MTVRLRTKNHQYLVEEFGEQIIGYGGLEEWPPRSPDLTPMDFSSGGPQTAGVCDPLNQYCKIFNNALRMLVPTAKDVKTAEIHRQITEVYEENILSEGMVRKWVRAIKDVRTNVHDEERSGRPSVITEDLVQKVDGKVRTDALRFHIYVMSFLKFQEVFFIEL
ncbi:hypothetical protein AVEN_134964-1 [Araneus ventricosus]|uniref:Mos1 transposase HTH domain-containing protein n=1 Tax=Araneus ventricosus TaxID=182803 RepID=A0A4Y2CJ16_ARAVE|nr:hypothetical protein AVEN_134964-1 [Araneus ventricosus]